jgi:hypothetical protein
LELEWIAACQGIETEDTETTLIGIHADGVLIEGDGVLPVDAHIPIAASIAASHSELEHGVLATFAYRVLDPTGVVANEGSYLHRLASPVGMDADLPRRGVVTVWVEFPIRLPGRYEIQLSLGDQVRALPFSAQVVPAGWQE